MIVALAEAAFQQAQRQKLVEEASNFSELSTSYLSSRQAFFIQRQLPSHCQLKGRNVCGFFWLLETSIHWFYDCSRFPLFSQEE